jgi:hypothetical protein
MTKRWVLVALAALSLVVGTTVAQGATKTKKHNAASKVDARLLRTAGNVNTWTGTIDGKLGHGAVRFTTQASGSTIATSATALFPNGSLKAKGTTTPTDNGDGTFKFTGKLTVVSATGAFRGAKGSVAVNGATVANDLQLDGAAYCLHRGARHVAR